MTDATVATTPETATQSEFAALLGVHKSHVTRLKQAGRLVLVQTPEGERVDVEASKQRIAETEGGRDDVAERFAAEKAAAGSGQLSLPNPDSEKRATAQARDLSAKADMSEMERDKMYKKLFEREPIEMFNRNAFTAIRTALENLPDRMGLSDEKRLELESEIEHVLEELSNQFKKWSEG